MIACLDHGFVELISVAPSSSNYKKIVDQMCGNKINRNLLKMPMIYFKISAPLFVINSLNSFKKITDNSYKPLVYHPKIDEINAKDLDTSSEITSSIISTIEAGLINQLTYQEDGCNPFISTFTNTVCTYWSGVIYGDLDTWCSFFKEKHAPHQIKVYQKAVEDLLKLEYPYLDDYLRRVT